MINASAGKVLFVGGGTGAELVEWGLDGRWSARVGEVSRRRLQPVYIMNRNIVNCPRRLGPMKGNWVRPDFVRLILRLCE